MIKFAFADFKPYSSEIFSPFIDNSNSIHLLKDFDFSAAVQAISSTYDLSFGAPAIDISLLIKLLLIKYHEKKSDVQVCRMMTSVIDYRLFLGVPDSMKSCPIDPSTLTNFRRKHLGKSNVAAVMLKGTFALAKKHGLQFSDRYFVDSTHQQSRYRGSSYLESFLNILREYREKVCKPNGYCVVGLENIKTVESARVSFYQLVESTESLDVVSEVSLIRENLREAFEKLNEEYLQKMKDRDATVVHKKPDEVYHGYKVHTAINEEGMVSAFEVTKGKEADYKHFIVLRQMIEKVSESPIKSITGDGAYGFKDNVRDSVDNNYDLFSNANVGTQAAGSLPKDYQYNKDSNQVICPKGNVSYRVSSKEENIRVKVEFPTSRCKECEMNSECLKGRKIKRIWMRKPQEIFAEQERKMETTEGKEQLKKRKRIEGVFGILKQYYGLDMADEIGVSSVSVQALMILVMHNVRKIAKMMKES